MKSLIRRMRSVLAKGEEEGQSYAYGGGGLLFTVLVVVVVVLLLR